MRLTAAAFMASVMILPIGIGWAQDKAKPAKAVEGVSCNEFAPAAKQVMGRSVGVEQCRIVAEEMVFNIKGQKFRRLEIRLTGTVNGWASLEKGSRSIYFTDGPDFVFTQSGLTGARAEGIAGYEASTGHGLTVLFPEDPRQWNGKLFITAHGAGSYGAVGTLVPRDPNAKFNPLQDVNRYVALMIDKGYAVAHTMRSADRLHGDVTVTLSDGTTLKNNLSSHAGLITTWTRLAQNLIAKRLGAMPRHTYFYGHSAGGFLGRLINYAPGANVDSNGKAIFDGFLLDDAGSGLWLPKLIVDGKDVLFTTEESRGRFAKQIDITHMLYAGDSGDYLERKRENGRLLVEKGLGAKHRLYEIRGVSHFDAGQVDRSDLVFQTLDLGGIFDALIDRLDQWVEKGIAPTPSKADVQLSSSAKNGVSNNAAVALPEIACPLGAYYAYPPELSAGRRGGQETAFAGFDGVNLEPLDGRGMLVDMNGDGKRDRRETVNQAWHRLGLLKSGQNLTAAAYQSCVKAAAGKLVREGLLPASVADYYVQKSSRARIGN